MVKRCTELRDNIITHPMESVIGASIKSAMEEVERRIKEHKSGQVAGEEVTADQMDKFYETTSRK
jgi:hypothetical protein